VFGGHRHPGVDSRNVYVYAVEGAEAKPWLNRRGPTRRPRHPVAGAGPVLGLPDVLQQLHQEQINDRDRRAAQRPSKAVQLRSADAMDGINPSRAVDDERDGGSSSRSAAAARRWAPGRQGTLPAELASQGADRTLLVQPHPGEQFQLHRLDQGPIKAVDLALGTVVGGEDDAQSAADKAC
jgi:hypothetical protein